MKELLSIGGGDEDEPVNASHAFSLIVVGLILCNVLTVLMSRDHQLSAHLDRQQLGRPPTDSTTRPAPRLSPHHIFHR